MRVEFLMWRAAVLQILSSLCGTVEIAFTCFRCTALREQLNGQLESCDIRIDESGILNVAGGSSANIKFPMWDLVFSSYIRTYQNLGLVVRLSWAPMLVGNIVLSIIVVAAEQITSTLWRLILELCFIFILVPFAAIVLVAWHRFILLDEKPEGHWFYFAASKRERQILNTGTMFHFAAIANYWMRNQRGTGSISLHPKGSDSLFLAN